MASPASKAEAGNISAPVLILGEHDKGHGEPFSRVTVSGRRLRRLLEEVGLTADLGNVFTVAGGELEHRNLSAATSGYRTVVALGRTAAAECARQGVAHLYLPHPAVRSMKQLDQLRAGLATLASETATPAPPAPIAPAFH